MASLVIADLRERGTAKDDGGGAGETTPDAGSGQWQAAPLCTPPGLDAALGGGARRYFLCGSLSTTTVAAGLLFFLATFVYMALEGLSFIDAMYLSTGVITTVGLVLVPRTILGRIFTAALNVASLGVGVLLLTEIAENRRHWTRSLLQRSPWYGLPDRSPWRLCCFCSRAASTDGGGGGGVPLALCTEVLSYAASTLPLVTLGALVFHAMEGWPLGEALYFCLLCASGLGMGDVEPRHWTSRLFFIVYVWNAMGVTLAFLGAIGYALHDALNASLARNAQLFPSWINYVGEGATKRTEQSLATAPAATPLRSSGAGRRSGEESGSLLQVAVDGDELGEQLQRSRETGAAPSSSASSAFISGVFSPGSGRGRQQQHAPAASAAVASAQSMAQRTPLRGKDDADERGGIL